MENLFDFYSLLYRIVRGWPVALGNGQEVPCKQLQTFAVLQDESQLNAGNLEKDARYIGKELFYSRLWANRNWRASDVAFSYPGLFLFVDDQDLSLSGDSCFQNVVSLRAFVLDKYPRKNSETHAADDPCLSRTAEEVEADTLELMERFLSLLMDTVEARVILPGNIEQTLWAPKSALAESLANGEIMEYEELDDLSLSVVLKNQTFPVISIANPFGMDDIVGSFVQFGILFQRELSTTMSLFQSETDIFKG